MPDPVSISAGSTAIAAGTYLAKRGMDAAGRVLGKSGDVLGEYLAQWTDERLANVGRIAENADRKVQRRLGEASDGSVPPRVAHRILEEGSWCDDEVMTEYLGGVLAGSRTPDGRDDRAVAWAALVAAMSTQQVRSHFLFYRTWDRLLRGRTDVPVSVTAGRNQAVMQLDFHDFVGAMAAHDPTTDVDPVHCIVGLIRLSLLEDEWAVGGPPSTSGPYPFGIKVKPSVAGFELYGWALGIAGMNPANIAHLTEEPLQTEPPYPLLESAVLPGLPPLEEPPQTDQASAS